MMRIVLCSFLAAAVLLGCERQPDATQADAPGGVENVLLITLDTTRADRLGCYGYKEASTPALAGGQLDPHPSYAESHHVRDLYGLAERVCELTQRRHPGPLMTLAAAYAETGSFDEAIATASPGGA